MGEEDGANSRSDGDLDDLRHVIGMLLPGRDRPFRHRRVVLLGDEDDQKPGTPAMDRATLALADTSVDPSVDFEVVIELLRASDALPEAEDTARFEARIIAHIERRWRYFAPDLYAHVAQSYRGYTLLDRLPRLRRDPGFILRLASELQSRSDSGSISWPVELLAHFAPETQWEARTLITAVDGRNRQDLLTSLFCAIGRGMGWTPWVTLFAIIACRPEYAQPRAAFEVEQKSYDSRELLAARQELADAIEPQTELRAVAAMVLELAGSRAAYGDTSLLQRPAEVRAAYAQSLKERVEGDAMLRRAVIEALLWWPSGPAADLAQFTAVVLAEGEDREWLADLDHHPVPLVHYAARAVRTAKFGDRRDVAALPGAGTLLDGLALREADADAAESPRTWLGDRAIERLIERMIASVEANVASEYDSHGDEGEDRLLSSLFQQLALRFGDLDEALASLARASTAPYEASVSMQYRNVDRAEEGAMGIKGAKSFSADLCLIVDPVVDGTSLGRRVTLVQAKRLYRNKKAVLQPAWHSSFRLDRNQRLALQAQTNSSVYFFHGPPLGGRGVPVIPTQLVADLSEYQGSGSSLHRDVVAIASRSLADWLTYDALALRVGDPFAALVEKADGGPGSLPRRLLDLPRVEMRISRGRRSSER